MSAASRSIAAPRDLAPIQWGSRIVGVVFLGIGVLGFVPGITEPYHSMRFATWSSEPQLLHYFRISILHNLVHLAFGVAGLVFARTVRSARNYLVVGGVLYALLGLYGVEVPEQSAANFLPTDDADDFLHFVLGFGMLALAVLLNRRAPLRNR